MAIHFFINGTKRDLAHVYVSVRNSRTERFICKTGLLVEPSRWSNETETVRQRKLTRNDHKLIESIKGLREYIDSANRLPCRKSKEWLQGVIDKYNGGKDDQSKTLNGFLTDFIEKAGKGDIKNKQGSNFAKGTLTNFKGFQKALSEYQGIYSEERISEILKAKKQPRKRMIVDFEDVTIDFYRSFVSYLSNEGYELNTMDKFIGILKYIMRKALVEKKHSNREFMEAAFSGFSEDSHAVYLTHNEIQRIWMVELTGGYERARDAFIVLCETALRVSDYRKVDLSIRGQLVYLYQTKTSARVIIPISSRLQAILNKYQGKLPEISDQKINLYIKEICRDCGITEKVSWVAHERGLKVPKEKEKCDLITCHTARRSACTNMYLSGIPSIDIMKISGHRTERSFLKYIRVNEEETAKRLADHPYFQNLRVV
jgi:integrase